MKLWLQSSTNHKRLNNTKMINSLFNTCTQLHSNTGKNQQQTKQSNMRTLSLRTQLGARNVSRSLTGHLTLLQGVRHYRYEIGPELLPMGQTVSRFQSGVSPSQRQAVIKELALAPSFGSRIVGARIGSSLPPSSFVRHIKPQLRSAIAAALSITPEDVDLGVVKRGPHAFESSDIVTSVSRQTPSTLLDVYFHERFSPMRQVDLGYELATQIISESCPDLVRLKIVYATLPLSPKVAEPSTLFDKPVTFEDRLEVENRWRRRTSTGAALQH